MGILGGIVGGITGALSSVPILGDVLGAGIEHASAKDLQHRGHDFDREMWDKQSAFAVEQFGRESDLQRELQKSQFDYQMRGVQEQPGRLVKGLKQAGLNPILAASGGFRANSPNVSMGSASASTPSSARSGSPSGAKMAIGQAYKNIKLTDSQANLNSALSATEASKQRMLGEQAGLYAAQKEQQTADTKLKLSQNEAIMFDNIRKAKRADVYDDAFGTFLTYMQEIGIDKLAILAAIFAGPTVLGRYLLKHASKEHLPKIISLGKRFYTPSQMRKFKETMNRLRGKE